MGQTMDTIFLKNGNFEIIDLIEINSDNVIFKYPNEIFSVNTNISLSSKIKTRNNREIKFGQKKQNRKVNSVEDWEKVIITNLPSEVDELQSIANVTGKAKAITTLGSLEKIQNRAMTKIKMQAAFYGCDYVYMLNQQNVASKFGTAYNSGQTAGSTLSGTAYSVSTEDIKDFQEGEYYLYKVLKLGPNDLKYYPSTKFDKLKLNLDKSSFVFDNNYYSFENPFELENSDSFMRLISLNESRIVFLLKTIDFQSKTRYYNFFFSNQDIDFEINNINDSIMPPGIYYNDLKCDIEQELSEEDVKIKYLNETGRAYNKLIVKKEDLMIHNIDFSWSYTSNIMESEVDSTKLLNSPPGLYYKGKECIVLQEVSETEVKIKYRNETGRAFDKVIALKENIYIHKIEFNWSFQVDKIEINSDTINISDNSSGLYYNGIECFIVKEVSETEVKIKYRNETGRAFDKLIVLKEEIIFNNLDHTWNWNMKE